MRSNQSVGQSTGSTVSSLRYAKGKSKADQKLKVRIFVSYMGHVVPDRVPGAVAVDPAIFIQDDVSFQVSIVVMSRVEVGDNTGRDAETAKDWNTRTRIKQWM